MQEFIQLLSELELRLVSRENVDAKKYVESKGFHLFYSLEDLMGMVLKWFKDES